VREAASTKISEECHPFLKEFVAKYLIRSKELRET
jgi:hypothetical protein